MLWRVLIIEGVLGAVLFTSAGRVDLPWFWVVLAIHGSMMAAGMQALDPGLREERLRPAPGGRSRQFRFLALPMILAHLVVAGVDVGRFDWSGPIPLTVRVLGLIGYVAGIGLSMWAGV